ncbi:SIMPL domain-containing protein [Psychrobacillus sp. FSL K6-4046]|uniref:SIMPL domain-containing protein n=1 Tax=Psychrobacillus sp. FSL K6-4046 TaxID=2921550 RepID=UPI00260EB95C|nr:SIMPL domain-containing protein [uncultured Psychrobacillus sp.]
MYLNALHPWPLIRTISVNGEGSITVPPNYALLQIEVTTEGSEVEEAQQRNAAIMNQVIQSILELGIPRENIQTAAYNIFPRYDFVDGKQVFRGYEVTNAISVKIPDVSMVGKVIDTAVRNGANRISSLEFRLENEDAYYQRALSKALINAQLKSNTIAETMRLSVSPQVIEVVEEKEGSPIVPYRAMLMESSTGATPIEQGVITIIARVTVKFQY